MPTSTSTSPSNSPPHMPDESPKQKQQNAIHRSIHRINTHPTLSPFRRRIYRVLLSIPPGRWTTYAALAKYMSSTSTSASTNSDRTKGKENLARVSRSQGTGTGKGSARAVGTAMRTNPFAPDVPCHRVLAADGTLGGYMGDGPSSGGENLQRKREMLEGEGVRFSEDEGCGRGKGKKGPRAEGECFVEFVG